VYGARGKVGELVYIHKRERRYFSHVFERIESIIKFNP
jgi:hypothetical protein